MRKLLFNLHLWTDRLELLHAWIERWEDLIDFEVVPVLSPADFWAGYKSSIAP